VLCHAVPCTRICEASYLILCPAFSLAVVFQHSSDCSAGEFPTECSHNPHSRCAGSALHCYCVREGGPTLPPPIMLTGPEDNQPASHRSSNSSSFSRHSSGVGDLQSPRPPLPPGAAQQMQQQMQQQQQSEQSAGSSSGAARRQVPPGVRWLVCLCVIAV
jgi:hypothetical protein